MSLLDQKLVDDIEPDYEQRAAQTAQNFKIDNLDDLIDAQSIQVVE